MLSIFLQSALEFQSKHPPTNVESKPAPVSAASMASHWLLSFDYKLQHKVRTSRRGTQKLFVKHLPILVGTPPQMLEDFVPSAPRGTSGASYDFSIFFSIFCLKKKRKRILQLRGGKVLITSPWGTLLFFFFWLIVNLEH